MIYRINTFLQKFISNSESVFTSEISIFQSSNDSQLSLGADSSEQQSLNNSSSVLEQARGSNNSTIETSGWNGSGSNSIFRHMADIHDIQRYFATNDTLTTEGVGISLLSTTATSSAGTTTLRDMDTIAETTTSTSHVESSLRSIEGIYNVLLLVGL